MSVASLRDFIRMESAGGIILLIAAVLAMIAANSFLEGYYFSFLDTKINLSIGSFAIDKPLLLWINDGLMAVFFFLVGLEIKREVLEGQLSTKSQLALPLVGAIGGIAVPALLYTALNSGNTIAMNGWAIPAATDIAFALGVMALLGNRVPTQLKLMLLAIAIIDDLGAIVIIALFYTSQLSLLALAGATAGLFALIYLNKKQVSTLTPYVMVGLFIWVCVLKSGIHATLAGVVVAAFIPLRVPETGEPWTEKIEHKLHPWVAFLILPVFAFANAGVPLGGMSVDAILHPISLGIIIGLVIGKPVGVFGAIWLAVTFKLAALPRAVNWAHIYGMSILCGIGFTMSLFIGSLAFSGLDNFDYDRIGILAGSVVAALIGYATLRMVPVSDTKTDVSPGKAASNTMPAE